MKTIKNIASAYLRVDLRTLGIFRIAIGFICFLDVIRRIPYISTFYSRDGVAPNQFISEITGTYSTKAFTLLSSLNTDTEVTIFFYITAVFAFLFMIGYKTKLSHIITLIGILSIHNRLIILENGGDLVLNNMLIWSVFLPLGKRFSFDRILGSLDKHKDHSPESLNTGKVVDENEPTHYWGLAYFACLLQLSMIYFYNYINKDGSTWESLTSIYYFYKLDTFLTPIGYYTGELGLMPLWLSKLLTHATLSIELIVPFLILAPFFTVWFRRFSFISFVCFHTIIGLSLYIGMFSWVMISSLIMLLGTRDIDFIAGYVRRLSFGPHTVFYDSDCGFCHQIVRIIKRMDLFNNLTWAGKDWDGETPEALSNLRETTIIVWDKSRNEIYTRHIAFSKIIGSLPFGFLDAWILRLPVISYLSGYLYDLISNNRTSISTFLGYSACDISKEHKDNELEDVSSITPLKRACSATRESIKTVAVFVLIISALQYSLTRNDGLKDWLKDNGYKTFKSNSSLNKISKQTRMIQRWNMFAPSTPRSYQWCIIEATLKDGSVIDLQTGKPPVYDKLDYYTYNQIDNSQFMRKYFSRIVKKNYKRYRPQLKKVLLSSNNPIRPYDDLNQDGVVDISDRIESVQLFKLSKSINSPLSKNKVEKKVRKTKIDLDGTKTSRSKPTPPKRRK